MMKIIFSTLIFFTTASLYGCMSREEAAKHVTITLVQSPEATLAEWHLVTTHTIEGTQRFKSPLGSIEITRTPNRLTSAGQPLLNKVFLALKQKIEQQIAATQLSLINPSDDDLLRLAKIDFLHTTYRTRNPNNQRQRIELFLASINNQLITIDVRIGDDADMQSYSDLQTFLIQQIQQISQPNPTDSER